MDLEEQGKIQRLVEAGARDRMLAVLGTPNPMSTRMVAMTLRDGDPSFAGPLAGIPLGLPVYHIVEEQVKEAIDPGVYEHEVGPMEYVLDSPAIAQAVEEVRQEQSA
jgi:hypothetical protein